MDWRIVLVAAVISSMVIVSLTAWRCRLEGNIRFVKDLFTYSGFVALGGKRIGVGLSYRHTSRYLFFGPMNNPWVQMRLRRKRRAEVRRWAKVKSFLKGWKKTRTVPVRTLWQQIRASLTWESFGIRGEFGLSDPFVTGQVFGTTMALLNLIPADIQQVQLVPDFTGRKLMIDYHSTFRIRPAVLAWRMGRAFLRRNR